MGHELKKTANLRAAPLIFAARRAKVFQTEGPQLRSDGAAAGAWLVAIVFAAFACARSTIGGRTRMRRCRSSNKAFVG